MADSIGHITPIPDTDTAKMADTSRYQCIGTSLVSVDHLFITSFYLSDMVEWGSVDSIEPGSFPLCRASSCNNKI